MRVCRAEADLEVSRPCAEHGILLKPSAFGVSCSVSSLLRRVDAQRLADSGVGPCTVMHCDDRQSSTCRQCCLPADPVLCHPLRTLLFIPSTIPHVRTHGRAARSSRSVKVCVAHAACLDVDTQHFGAQLHPRSGNTERCFSVHTFP